MTVDYSNNNISGISYNNFTRKPSHKSAERGPYRDEDDKPPRYQYLRKPIQEQAPIRLDYSK